MLKRIWLWIADCFRIHEDKALHKNKSFWFAIFFPMFWIGLIFLALTMELQNEGLFNPRITSDALNGFVKFYAFPITLLTLPLTFAVMVNRFHSSKQKAKSNNLVERNNIANNYFSHFDSFKNYCEELEKKHSKINTEFNAQILYQSIFINSNITNFNPKVSKSQINSLISRFLNEIELYKVHIETIGYEFKETRTVNQYKLIFDKFEGVKVSFVINNDHQFYNSLIELVSIFYDMFIFQGVLFGKKASHYFQKEVTLIIDQNFTTFTNPTNGSPVYHFNH